MKHNSFSLGRLTSLLVVSSTILMAQGSQTANITGQVREKGGNPLSGVVVTISSPALQGARSFTSDSNGHFLVRLLPPGSYSVTLVKGGMVTVKEKVTLGIDQNWNANFTMVKEGAAIVEVIASTPAVDKTDVKTATNLEYDTLDRLPQARTPEGAALLTPGVVTGVGGRVQIRGAMTSGNLYLMDGQNVSDNAYNNRGVRVISDSIEETQTITGAISAEYGNVDGGVVNSITKVGGNEFTGQLRWELSNPAWNAKAPSGFTTDANGNPVANPSQNLENQLGEEKTLSLGGFIIKDKLWFYASFYNRSFYQGQQIDGGTPGVGGGGSDFTYGIKETRRQAKLTWAVNTDHTVTLAMNNSQNSEQNRDYSAGSLSALIPQAYHDYYWNLSLKSMWTPNITSDLKFGQKHQLYSAGPADTGQAPIYNYSTQYYINQGIFNGNDGGDNRNNKTFNGKVSLFVNGAGSHQIDIGVDLYQGVSRAANDQSPHVITNPDFAATGPVNRSIIFGVQGTKYFTLDNGGSAIPTDIWTFITGQGEAKNNSTGIFVNDKWQIDQHWNVQVGVRYDNFKAKNEEGVSTASNGSFSPRLGMKYDVLGDSKWILGASFARYNSKVLEAITNAVTRQGNATEIDYNYTGPTTGINPLSKSNYQNFATIQNLANYTFTGANISYYSDPTVNVKLSPNLKAPHVDELQGSAAYTIKTPDQGEGFLKVTGIYKKWADLIDYRAGNDGQVDVVVGGVTVKNPYVKVWGNNPDAKRYYRGLEFDSAYTIGSWEYTGNITWSKLEGNYEGESSNSPGRGEGLNYFTQTNGVTNYDNSITAPRGYLAGDVPISMNLMLSHFKENAYGKITYGAIYRFQSGHHYSNTRLITDPQGMLGVPSDYGLTATEYMNGMRGQGVFNASAYLDLAITQDFTVFKVPYTDKKVFAFAKIVFANVLNHQQIISWNHDFADNGDVVGAPWAPATSLNGLPTSSTNYATPRTITASAGFRF